MKLVAKVHRAGVGQRIDGAAFGQAWAEGRAMTLDQAIAYALDEPPSSG